MERIIIIVRDEVGVIADVTRTLADRGVNIESLDTERAGEQGIITLTTDDTDTALRALARAGFRARARTTPWCSGSPTSPERWPGWRSGSRPRA